MKPVQFLRDPSTADISSVDSRGTIVIYRKGFYSPPPTRESFIIDFEEFKTKYDSLSFDSAVIIGLNRMINPANRCDFVFSFLSTATPNIPKYSIDNAPFIGEPWRVFWHYLFTKSGHWPESHSYAVETNWKKWFFREESDWSGSADNIRLMTGDTTFSDLPKLTSSFSFSDASEHEEWYASTREQVFKMHSTPKSWIQSLLRECNKRFGFDIGYDISYDSYLEGKSITVPDLGVYRFVVEENLRRMAIYNAVTQ